MEISTDGERAYMYLLRNFFSTKVASFQTNFCRISVKNKVALPKGTLSVKC